MKGLILTRKVSEYYLRKKTKNFVVIKFCENEYFSWILAVSFFCNFDEVFTHGVSLSGVATTISTSII